MFAVLYSDINSPKSSLLHLTGQPYWKKSRSAKVKVGIINFFLGTISLIDTGASLAVVNYTPDFINYASRVINYASKEHLGSRHHS